MSFLRYASWLPQLFLAQTGLHIPQYIHGPPSVVSRFSSFPCLTRFCMSTHSVGSICTSPPHPPHPRRRPISLVPWATPHSVLSVLILHQHRVSTGSASGPWAARHPAGPSLGRNLPAFTTPFLSHLWPAPAPCPILLPARVPPCLPLLLPQVCAFAAPGPTHLGLLKPFGLSQMPPPGRCLS